MRSYWTYIRASKPHGTLYIGVTNDLVHRIDQHRAGKGSAFTRRYGARRSEIIRLQACPLGDAG